ncbi:hypothetical protein GCM10023205_04780 [Yinghuangia aomiensis]|uniref:Uncharacterized protein n=1 Tax=Yinghuangia aomiensis TaxID=676205 RepID=A0ABP9GM27_9ACTN
MTPPPTAPLTPAAGDDHASPVPQQRLQERDFTPLFAGRTATRTGTAAAVALPLVANAFPALLVARSLIRRLRTISPEPQEATRPPVHNDMTAAADRASRAPEATGLGAAPGAENGAITGGGSP